MVEKRTCLKCGAALSRPATGRPPSYCGPTCRRASEFELRRVQRRLQNLEAQASGLRHDDGLLLPAYRKSQLAVVGTQIEEAEQRLRELLAGGASTANLKR